MKWVFSGILESMLLKIFLETSPQTLIFLTRPYIAISIKHNASKYLTTASIITACSSAYVNLPVTGQTAKVKFCSLEHILVQLSAITQKTFGPFIIDMRRVPFKDYICTIEFIY